MDKSIGVRDNPAVVALPPMTRSEFEEMNRRLLMGEGFLPEAEISSWESGRDWLAQRVRSPDEAASRRRSPRLQISLTAHIAGVGRAVTDDVGFWGMRLLSEKALRLARGDEASVRVSLVGRSIYLLGRVVWVDRDRVGLALDAAHPADERALQAAVCSGLIDRWEE